MLSMWFIIMLSFFFLERYDYSFWIIYWWFFSWIPATESIDHLSQRYNAILRMVEGRKNSMQNGLINGINGINGLNGWVPTQGFLDFLFFFYSVSCMHAYMYVMTSCENIYTHYICTRAKMNRENRNHKPSSFMSEVRFISSNYT